ncbi:MAG: F0F1 ATP synthase subunit B [Eubacteriaceae bacterium]|nr:F0F1 ATP synthase subunit B [Eubacteriaceae bacterium]
MNLGIIQLDWSALMIVANVVILYFVMKHFFFEKIHNFMQARQDAVKDAIAAAEDINKKADLKMENYQRKIARVESEGRDIIRDSKMKADEQAKRIITEAGEKAGEMTSKAEKEIQREKVKALAGMRSEVTTLALMAASKIMEQELSGSEEQKKLVDKVIEEAGTSGWQS